MLPITSFSAPMGGAGDGSPREDGLVSGERKIQGKEGRGKKKEEINLAAIKPLTVLTANPQVHKHTEGVLGIKAFN